MGYLEVAHNEQCRKRQVIFRAVLLGWILLYELLVKRYISPTTDIYMTLERLRIRTMSQIREHLLPSDTDETDYATPFYPSLYFHFRVSID